MKKIILLISAITMLFSIAHADDITIGYCDGGGVDGDISGVNAVAIKLPAAEFPMYAGSKITGVRIGLASNASKGVKVFVRESLDGKDLCSTQSGSLYKGWADIYFDNTAEYPASDIYVGYELPAGVKAGLSQIAGYRSDDAFLALNGSKWENPALDGSNPLCIQLIVDGNTYTKNDAALIEVGNQVAELGKELVVSGLMRNNTAHTLESARIAYEYNGETREADVTVDNILPGELGLFSFTAEPYNTVGVAECKLNILSVAGNPDDYEFNNSAVFSLQVVGEIVRRKVLIEEFTGQLCPNCPTGKEILEETVKGLDDIVMVCHHIGFGEDAMTAPGSIGLIFFYNEGSKSFAPAVMFDRTPTEDRPGPVGNILSAKSMRERILDRQKTGAQAYLGLEADINPDGTLHIKTNTQKVKGATVGNKPVLTVLLVEDGIVAYQSGSNLYDNYVHNEVVRQFVTPVLGDVISLSDDKPTINEYSVKLSKDWNPEKMRIVAFVSNYNSSDPNDCEVYNAETVDMPDFTGIAETYNDCADVTEIYDLSGCRIADMQKGVNIVRMADGSTRKVIL